MSNCNIVPLMQGDQCYISFRIKKNGSTLVIPEVEKIQFTIGDLIKYYGDEGEVIFDNNTGLFYFPLSEKESFELQGPQFVQVRIKFTNGDIKGKKYGNVNVQYAYKKEEM